MVTIFIIDKTSCLNDARFHCDRRDGHILHCEQCHEYAETDMVLVNGGYSYKDNSNG